MNDKQHHDQLTATVLPARVSLAPSARLITHLDDPRLTGVISLKNRSSRDSTSTFLAEGMRFVHFAVENGVSVETVLYAPSELKHPLARTLVADLIDKGVPTIAITSEILQALADREDPQGVIAVTRQFTQPLAMSTPAAGLCWIAVDRVQSPGNLGTLLRTAECVGAAGLIMIGNDVDPYDPGSVRGSMGAIFNLRIVRTTFDDLLDWANRHHAAIIGTSPRAKLDYHRTRYDRPSILYLGCERKGIDEDRQRQCDMLIRIPMVGRSDSLNVGVAGSVILYEIFNQRRSVRQQR